MALTRPEIGFTDKTRSPLHSGYLGKLATNIYPINLVELNQPGQSIITRHLVSLQLKQTYP